MAWEARLRVGSILGVGWALSLQCLEKGLSCLLCCDCRHLFWYTCPFICLRVSILVGEWRVQFIAPRPIRGRASAGVGRGTMNCAQDASTEAQKRGSR